MVNNWNTVRLGDHVDASLGKMLDKNKNQGAFHPYLGNKQVRWGSFDLDDLSEMKFQDHEHERYGLKPGDLVVCEGGEPGRCAIWKGEVPDMKIQKALHRIRPHDGLDSIFLHYWFCYAGKFELLDPYFTGTTIKHLTGKAVAELPIPLPPLPEQKAIAHILGSLDDKIELNRRMNATLEGMAQSLFKSWFVDFDPVIDNALEAGNPIPSAFAARAETRRRALCANAECGSQNAEIHNSSLSTHHSLFPATFHETEEMGWIPEGWEVKQVKDFGSVVCGKTPSKKNADYYGDAVPFIKIPDMHQSAWITDTSDGLSSEGAISQAKKEVPENSICVSCIATVGKVIITSRASHTNQQINSVIPDRDCFRYYLYFAFSRMTKELHDLASGGSATLNLNTGNFSKIKILFPTGEALESYFRSVDPQFQKMLSNDLESQTLTKLRDTLLPKLISGELRIEDAEKMVGEMRL